MKLRQHPCTGSHWHPLPLQLAIGNDRCGEQTAAVLGHVVRALAADFSWRPHLLELLQGLDEVGYLQ